MENFQGGTFTLRADGNNADVYGDNGTGKTRQASAFTWLLFDKDSLGRSDFEIKNLDSNGEQEHGLDHSVEGVFDINGATTTLKKIYRETWTKKRGSAKAVFTGNTTDYFLDGVPVQKKDYVARVDELAGDEAAFRLLTSPTTYANLPWQKRRAILLEACGDFTDQQVIESDSALAPLAEILGKRSLDDHKKVIAARRSEINKELEKIPTRIDEVKRGLPDITGVDYDANKDEVARLDAAVGAAKLRLQGIDNGGGIAELSKQLQEVKLEIGQLENKYYLEGMKHVTKLNARINEITSNLATEQRAVQGIKDEIAEKQARITSLDTQLEKLRGEWTAIDAETFQDTTEDVCAACDRALPPDRVEEARTKALATFNQSKAERLLVIETKGKSFAAELSKAKEQIEKLHAELRERPDEGQNEFAGLTAERDALKTKTEDYTQIPGRAELLEQKAAIEKQIEESRAGVSQDKEITQKEVDTLTAQLKAAKAIADRFPAREQGEIRIQELMAEEKKLSAEFEKLEQELFLCESFIKVKVSLLTDRINARFKLARFKLFETQVNGGISECCEITVGGIPFGGGLNSAARTNAGLDICRTLAQHYGLLAPIFVDNAESVCQLIDMDAQVIRLIVSEPDKVLRVEVATDKKRVAA